MWLLLFSILPINRPVLTRKPSNRGLWNSRWELNHQLKLALTYLDEVLAHICHSYFYYFIIEGIATEESLETMPCKHPVLVAGIHIAPKMYFFERLSPCCVGMPLLKLKPKSGLPIPVLLLNLSLEVMEPAACMGEIGQCSLVTVQTTHAAVVHTAGTVRWAFYQHWRWLASSLKVP